MEKAISKLRKWKSRTGEDSLENKRKSGKKGHYRCEGSWNTFVGEIKNKHRKSVIF